MKPFISQDEMDRLAREAFEGGELLANVMFPMVRFFPVRGPVVDELGRTWVLPADEAGMRALFTRYRRMHGRVSSAVDRTFTRHGRLDTLRMLIVRCVEGEPINLAARALALGPVQPTQRNPSWPADRPWPHDILDAQTRQRVEAEDRRMRSAGYRD